MKIQKYIFILLSIFCLNFAQECDEGYSYFDNLDDFNNVTVQDDGTCFYDLDLQTLSDINTANQLDLESFFSVGTQTWNEGRLRFLVANHYHQYELSVLPESIGNLNDLRQLYLEWNNLTTLPDSFSQLTALISCYISNNQLESLPENIGNLENLYILDLGYNEITSIPESIVNLSNLTYLWLFNNQLTYLPEDFCNLNLDWDGDDTWGYPYFAIGGNMLCENLPECVANSEHLDTSLEQYYYSVQITVEQDCDHLNINEMHQIDQFKIIKSYPNPFNPFTEFEIVINEPNNFNIDIFDTNGKIIKRLLKDEYLTNGTYHFSLEAENLSSGVYILNISNRKYSDSLKLLLQK